LSVFNAPSRWLASPPLTPKQEVKNMVEFETLEEKEVKLAKGSLIVALKKAISENGETEFVSIAKTDGSGKFFKQTLTLPKDKEIVNELVRALQTVV